MKKTSVFTALGIVALILSSCSGGKTDLYYEIPKIDTHVHIRTVDPAIMQAAIAENFKFFTICTRANSQEYIDEQLYFAKTVHKQFPQVLSYATTFSMEKFDEPGWEEEVIRKLKRDFKEGAIAMKVWKDIGMTFRDSLGNFIMIDDARFDPIFDYIVENNITVVAHIGEPRNCWLPLDSMTVNNDRNYYKEHPQYHMYLHPDYPSYEEQIASRDNLLAKHPGMRLVGAHLGSLEWSVDELAKRLDLYPNFAVDMAARVCHFQVQDRQKVRDFIIKYQDRLLYGTDFIINKDDDLQDKKTGMEKEWQADWKYFSTDEEMSSPNVNGSFKGLYLDETVLRNIYYENAMKWYPGML